MTCASCDKELQDGAKFCPSCGAPGTAETLVSESTEMTQTLSTSPIQKILKSKYLSGTRNRILIGAAIILLIGVSVVLAGGGVKSQQVVSKTPEQSCELNLSNWVISTSNYTQSNSGGIPPVMTEFGTTSEITQWVDSQIGSFITGMVQNGQSSADAQLATSAAEECQSLASTGTNIGAIPAP